MYSYTFFNSIGIIEFNTILLRIQVSWARTNNDE